jgi:hypothetical protein
MSPSMVSGARDTTNGLGARQIVDMGDLYQLENEKASLFTHVSKLKKNKAHNQTIKWMTDELSPKADAVNNGAGYAAGDTSIVVDNGGYFRIRDLVKVPRTGEVMLVTGVSTNTLTVTRSAGGTAAAAIVDNDPLIILGPAYAQGSTLQAARTTVEVEAVNYMQIMRHPFKVTGTHARMSAAGGHYVEGDVVTQRRKKGLEHARDINLVSYLGEKDLTSGTGLAGGIIERIPTANIASGATLTEAELNDALKTMFRYGSSTKTLFCSRNVAGIIDGLLRDRVRYAPSDKTGGQSISSYVSTHGTIKIVPDHALEGGELDKYAVLVDSDGLEFVTLQDTVLLTGRQTPDEDAEVEEYFTEFSFRWGNGSNHGLFNSVTA